VTERKQAVATNGKAGHPGPQLQTPPINQSNNQSINQSFKQSINQPTN
jgi:hypothetical protein